MSTIYNKTDNYALNLYGNNDPADLRDGYNDSMRTIDTTLKAHLDRIEGVESRETHNEEVITHNEEVMEALLGDNTADAATTAKTKWDKAGADAITANGKADSNTAILTALGAGTVEDATNLNKTINDTTLTDLVLIGDSYGEGVGATDAAHGYANLVAKALNLTLHNYCIGGTGFNNQGASGNGRFDAQMRTAVNDTNYDHSKVKYIIVEGGTNDWGGIAIAKTVTNTICSLARSSFPNARLLFALTQGVGPGSINLYPAIKLLNYRGIQEAAANYNNASVLRGDYWFNKWNASTYSSDDLIHPNDTGHQFIANKIVSALKYGDFQMTENLVSSNTQSYLTVHESQTDNITQFNSIIYFIGNGLGRLSADFRYTVQEEDVDSTGTFYRIDHPLLDFPDNVIINYPNVSIFNYFVTKLPDASELQSRHGLANLYSGNNKPLKFTPGTIPGLPANTAKAGDILRFSINCIFPYYGYAN